MSHGAMWVAHFVLLLILAQFATSAKKINCSSESKEKSESFLILNKIKTRHRHRSTSSSSGSKHRGDASSTGESLNVVFSKSDSSSENTDGTIKNKKKNRAPKSTAERRGWRKWHRKCTKCPMDMAMKWRDPRIKWICGAYQQARRSFKSLCMMQYRNCQDGTMFTKIADQRCPNGTKDGVRPYINHFFYDYKVSLTDEDSSSAISGSASEEYTEESSPSIDDSEIAKNMPELVFGTSRD